jgi:hypothetical protein
MQPIINQTLNNNQNEPTQPNLPPTTVVPPLYGDGKKSLTGQDLLPKLSPPHRGQSNGRFVKVYRWTVDTTPEAVIKT